MRQFCLRYAACGFIAGLTIWLWAVTPLFSNSLQTRAAKKVVFVAMRGASAARVNDYLARGVLPPDGAIARLAQTGVGAEYLQGIDGGFTSSGTVSLLTGAYPERHGIVGNIFHRQGNAISEETSGFESFSEAETLAEAALRQGKRVIDLSPIHPTGSRRDKLGVWTLLAGSQLSSGKVLNLQPTNQTPSEYDSERFEKARPLQANGLNFQLQAGALIPLFALAVDTVFDKAERYDTLLLDFDNNWRNGYAAGFRPGDWRSLTLAGRADAGAWLKLLNLSDDLSQARLYFAPTHRNQGRPTAFIDQLTNEVGFWPGYPDLPNFSQALIDEKTFIEQLERLANFKRDVALLCLKRFDFDLLLLDENVIDNASHNFFLLDPRQPGYDDEGGAKRARYAGYVEWSYRIADRNLRDLMAAATETIFAVASPYGMTATHRAISVTGILAKAGWRITTDDGSEVRAFAYGPIAHLRFNMRGREPTGVLPPERLAESVERVLRLFSGYRDSLANGPVFDLALKNSDLHSIRLGHPKNAGDVVLLARPGYVLSSQPESTDLRPRFLGDHGYLGIGREMQGVFFAAGPGLRKGMLGDMRVVDIAATISFLLGIEPPLSHQGRNALATSPAP